MCCLLLSKKFTLSNVFVSSRKAHFLRRFVFSSLREESCSIRRTKLSKWSMPTVMFFRDGLKNVIDITSVTPTLNEICYVGQWSESFQRLVIRCVKLEKILMTHNNYDYVHLIKVNWHFSDPSGIEFSIKIIYMSISLWPCIRRSSFLPVRWWPCSGWSLEHHGWCRIKEDFLESLLLSGIRLHDLFTGDFDLHWATRASRTRTSGTGTKDWRRFCSGVTTHFLIYK